MPSGLDNNYLLSDDSGSHCTQDTQESKGACCLHAEHLYLDFATPGFAGPADHCWPMCFVARDLSLAVTAY